MSANPRNIAPQYGPADAVAGLRRRQLGQTQAEIDAARAAGQWERAELLTLRVVNYPAWVAHQARESAAAVAGLPLCERLTH